MLGVDVDPLEKFGGDDYDMTIEALVRPHLNDVLGTEYEERLLAEAVFIQIERNGSLTLGSHSDQKRIDTTGKMEHLHIRRTGRRQTGTQQTEIAGFTRQGEQIVQGKTCDGGLGLFFVHHRA